MFLVVFCPWEPVSFRNRSEFSRLLTPEALARETAAILLGRGETPEEVALAGINMIRSSFITGEVLNINGGVFMRP